MLRSASPERADLRTYASGRPTKRKSGQCRYLSVEGKTIPDNNNGVENELSVEALAVMLVRGEFPENYDQIIREISDDDFERLWEIFEEKRKKEGTTVQIAGRG